MGCERCVKSLFYFLNGLLLVLGLASLGVGIWMAVDPTTALDVTRIGDLDTVNPGLIQVSGYIMIAAGGATALFALLGILGAYRDSGCLLGLYITLLVLALALQVTAIVLGVVFRKEVEKQLNENLTDSLEKYEGPDSDDAGSSAWDTFMASAKCCGVNGISNKTSDFDDTKWGETLEDTVNATIYVVPEACCKEGKNTTECMLMPDDSNSYQEGCLTRVKSYLYQYQAVIIGISGGIVAFQFLLVILAVCLFSQRNPSYQMSEK